MGDGYRGLHGLVEFEITNAFKRMLYYMIWLFWFYNGAHKKKAKGRCSI